MTIAQSSIAAMTRAYAGMLSDSSRDTNKRSYTSEEASDEIPFGVFVGQGADDDGMLKLATIADKVIGVLILPNGHAKDTEVGDTGLKSKMTGNVLSRGRCFVHVEEAVTPASLAKIRGIAVGAEKAGALRDTADASDLIVASSWVRFLGTTTGAGIVEIEFDVANRGADETD